MIARVYTRKRKDADGNTVKQYGVRYPWGGRYVRRLVGESKKAAEELAAAITSKSALGEFLGPAHAKMLQAGDEARTFAKVCEDYIADRKLRGRRKDSYRKLAAWKDALGDTDVSLVTLEGIERQLAVWKAKHKWSGSTYNRALSAVSGVLTYAHRKRLIAQHPLRGCVERMPESSGRERYFLPHELTAMHRTARALARLHKHPADWLADIIVEAPTTGLRRGNFCALRCYDVRRDERDDLYLRVGREKNGEPIEKRLVGAAREIVERNLEGRTPGAFLFPGPDGGNAYTSIGRYLPVVVRHVAKRHEDWGLRWGVKGDGVTFHSFRHAMASLALNAGVPMDTVQRMGGWKTASQVRVYARRADQGIRDGEDALAAVLPFKPAVKENLTPIDTANTEAGK